MSKKRAIIVVVILLLLIGFCIFKKTYANYDDSTNKKYVELVNKTDTVSIVSPLSLNDETGRNISDNKDGVTIYYKIKLKSKVDKTSNYKILFSNDIMNSIGNKYIKVLVSDKKDKILKFYDRDSFVTLDSIPTFNDSMVLHSGKLKGNDEDEFILRMWVSDFYVITDEEQVFKGKIKVYSY